MFGPSCLAYGVYMPDMLRISGLTSLDPDAKADHLYLGATTTNLQVSLYIIPKAN